MFRFSTFRKKRKSGKKIETGGNFLHKHRERERERENVRFSRDWRSRSSRPRCFPRYCSRGDTILFLRYRSSERERERERAQSRETTNRVLPACYTSLVHLLTPIPPPSILINACSCVCIMYACVRVGMSVAFPVRMWLGTKHNVYSSCVQLFSTESCSLSVPSMIDRFLLFFSFLSFLHPRKHQQEIQRILLLVLLLPPPSTPENRAKCPTPQFL